jgi:hypothetical protein
MSNSVFYSWQGDRYTSICRNFIERALAAAAERLRADIEVEEAVREGLEVDKDTKGVPGSPPIFETIMSKIAAASVFVPDLTFVGLRADGRPISNPNVLIEYGCALLGPGELRIIAVMNDAFGTPSSENMPFNLGHRRFPITYTLGEGATDEERKAARKSLTNKFESALRMVFDSPEFKASALSARKASSLQVAALYQKDLSYEDALASLRYGEGVVRVWENVRSLFKAIEAKCNEVESEFNFGIQSGWRLNERDVEQSCVMKTGNFGLVLTWNQPQLNSIDDAKLGIREFRGRLYIPGEPIAGVHVVRPELLSEMYYKPTLSAEHELGWVQSMRGRDEPRFVSTDDLADACVSQFLNLLRQQVK